MHDTLPINECQAFFGAPVPKRRIRSWAYQGVRGTDGTIVRLRTHKVVGRTYVNRADAEEFLRLTTPAPTPEVAPKPSRKQQAEDKRRVRQAREYLYSR